MTDKNNHDKTSAGTARRPVQESLDMRLQKTFVSRVDRLVGWERTERGLRIRACLSGQFNLGDIQKFADLYSGYGRNAAAEENLPVFAIDFEVVAPAIVRVRTALAPTLPPSPYEGWLWRPPATRPDFEVTETDDQIRLTTTEVELTVRRRSWTGKGVGSLVDMVSYSLRDRRTGRIVLDEIVDEKSIYFGYFAPPLGRARDEQGDWIVQSFARHDDEDFYGFGEQFTDFSKRGQVVEIWNADAGNCMGHLSYKNVPFFISTRGYAFLLGSTAHAVFDMGSRTAAGWTVRVRSPQLDYLVMVGEDPKRHLRDYFDLTGAPALPPRWSFGLWMSSISKYQNQPALVAAAEEIRSHGLPCDVLHIDPPWMDVESLVCTLAWGKRFPDPQAMIRTLRERGFKLCLWMSAYVPTAGEMYEDGLAKGFFLKDAEGRLLVNAGAMNFWSAPFVYVDFTNPAAAAWYKERCVRILRDGVAVLKTDLCELGPEEAVYHNGLSGGEGHNLFTREFARVVYEAAREVHGDEALIWCRSGTIGAQGNPVHWAGDVSCNFDSMLGQLRAILGAGMSGFVFFSHDIGGFQGRAWPELYIRWFQFGMFTSHARAHGGEDHEPWAYGAEAERICQEFARLRYSLMPYIYSSAVESCRQGLPLLRPLVLVYPGDRNVRHICDEYLFGPDLLVAPVFEDGARSRPVYLPEGDWLDWWSHQVVSGPRWITADAPLDRIPLYVRRGAIIPRVPPGEFLREGEPWKELRLDIFPAARGETRIWRTPDDFDVVSYTHVDGKMEMCCPKHVAPAGTRLLGA
jgi:alpha-D-xyloside xylohydrolase